MKLTARTSSDWKILAWSDTHESFCGARGFDLSNRTTEYAHRCKRTGRF